MLTQVDVFGVRSISQPLPQLSLPIFNAEDETIQIKGIKGLEPVTANISTALYGVVPGEAVTGTSIGKRNIVLTLGLNPDWETQTIDELRMLLYKYFMTQSQVRLQFTSTHLPTCEITGVVESMDPNMFSKDPEIQVSVICGRPELVASEETTLTGVVGALTDVLNIDYIGTVDTGIKLTVSPSATRGAWTGTLTITLGNGSFILDNVTVDNTRNVAIGSVPGNKYVREQHGGLVSLLGKLRGGYSWPVLKPGLNPLVISAPLTGQAWEMSYFAKFGGL